VIHRNARDGLWLDPEAQKMLDEAPMDENGLVVLEDALLDINDYESFMNPKILKETTELVYDWEFCSSFPNIRCMVKRPTGILV